MKALKVSKTKHLFFAGGSDGMCPSAPYLPKRRDEVVDRNELPAKGEQILPAPTKPGVKSIRFHGPGRCGAPLATWTFWRRSTLYRKLVRKRTCP